MRAIGVRELKEHASQLLRRVRERGEEIEVTHHGRVVARLIPVSRERSRPRASAAPWSTLGSGRQGDRRPLAERAFGGEGGAGRTSRPLMVVGASVAVSRLVPHDVHHVASRRWLTRHVAGGGLVIAPALLLPEVAGAVARRTGEPRLARRAVDAVLRLPALRLVPVDDVLARTAARLAGRLRLRGADAIYIAAAVGLRLPLVTWDLEQRDRAARFVEVLVPEMP